MAESRTCLGEVIVECGERDVGQQRREHPSHDVANKPWQFEVSIPRKQLRPVYGDGFHGAPLRCGEPAGGQDVGG